MLYPTWTIGHTEKQIQFTNALKENAHGYSLTRWKAGLVRRDKQAGQ